MLLGMHEGRFSRLGTELEIFKRPVSLRRPQIDNILESDGKCLENVNDGLDQMFSR